MNPMTPQLLSLSLSQASVPVSETMSLSSVRCFLFTPTGFATRETEAFSREARNFSWKSRRSCSVSPALGRRNIFPRCSRSHVGRRMRRHVNVLTFELNMT